MALSDRVATGTVKPVLLVYLNFNGDILRGWTGPGDLVIPASETGDADLDGFTFLQASQPFSITPVQESAVGSSQAVKITYSSHDLTSEVIRQVIGTPVTWRLRRACLWVGFLVSTVSSESGPFNNLVHDEIHRVYTGVMTHARLVRSDDREPNTIEMTLDQDLRNFYAPFRMLDHQRIWPADTFSNYIIRLANGQIAGAFRGNPGSGAGGGGGAFGPGGSGGLAGSQVSLL